MWMFTEPDVRAQDGVYTRYVTWLPGEGRYALTALANDHQGAASVLTPRRRGQSVHLFVFSKQEELECVHHIHLSYQKCTRS